VLGDLLASIERLTSQRQEPDTPRIVDTRVVKGLERCRTTLARKDEINREAINMIAGVSNQAWGDLDEISLLWAQEAATKGRLTIEELITIMDEAEDAVRVRSIYL